MRKSLSRMVLLQIPGYDVTCVGDDIAWLRFDQEGNLRAINPENGFFGVAPGTSDGSNPVAMQSIFKNTVFTNVALTDDGGVGADVSPLGPLLALAQAEQTSRHDGNHQQPHRQGPARSPAGRHAPLGSAGGRAGQIHGWGGGWGGKDGNGT